MMRTGTGGEKRAGRQRGTADGGSGPVGWGDEEEPAIRTCPSG
jgi:hypothetical protein